MFVLCPLLFVVCCFIIVLVLGFAYSFFHPNSCVNFNHHTPDTSAPTCPETNVFFVVVVACIIILQKVAIH